MLSRVLTTLLCFVLYLHIASVAQASEIIHRYHSIIEVEESGDIKVTETIEVTAEGEKIKRGIYYDFALQRRTFLGGILPTQYQILSVKRDGQTENYHTERIDDGKTWRVYFGQRDRLLTIGKRYTYEFTYSVPSQVFLYNDFDELYWNVIGPGWDFPIAKASAEIILPGGAPVQNLAVYTGGVLSTDSNYRAQQQQGSLLIQTTYPLTRGEGLTVAVSWPKGYVHEASSMTGLSFFWKQHPGLRLMLVALFFLAVYYRYAWRMVGKDPRSRGLAPFYDAPKGISPAMAACIHTMGSANKERYMTSAIISLAAKGYFEIEDIGRKRYKISKTNKVDTSSEISEDEQIIYEKMGESRTLKASDRTLIAMSEEHSKKIDQLCRKRYFYKNTWWWAGGLVIILLSFIALSLTGAFPSEFWVGGLLILAFGVPSLIALLHALPIIITGSAAKKPGSFFILIWGGMFSLGGFEGLYMVSMLASWLVIAAILIMIILFVAMRPIMKAPTLEGREVMDHINGLKHYMEAVEEKILKVFDPPQMSRELYEKYLPYAVALDVEAKWADKFGSSVGDAIQSSSKNLDTTPRWYRTSSRGISSSGFSASSMVSSFGSAISAASTSRSSSGGRGGSSGGGGGSSGGGGW